MNITVHLKDGTQVTASGPVLDIVHSSTDPKIIWLTNAGVPAYWFNEEDFEYAVNS